MSRMHTHACVHACLRVNIDVHDAPIHAYMCQHELPPTGDLQRQNVRVLGTQIPVIVATEDREIFSEKLHEINETLALSYPATDIEGATQPDLVARVLLRTVLAYPLVCIRSRANTGTCRCCGGCLQDWLPCARARSFRVGRAGQWICRQRSRAPDPR